MPKIDPQFSFDVFRFIIESRRNPLLSRFLGEPDAVEPEKSVQGIFERIQARIKELPDLLDPGSDVVELRLLAWLLGWDDSIDVSFIDNLSDNDLRKLIELSVPLWKTKGTAGGIINAIRVFTGKTAIVQDWFFHRWILDQTGFWEESRGEDPYLVGGQYTDKDQYLTWVIINREGLTAIDRRLIFDLLTYIRPVSEHFGIVYAAFADDFNRGFNQWTQIGAAGTLVVNEDDFRGGLTEFAKVKTNITDAELITWTPFQRIIIHIEFATDSVLEIIQMEGMRSEDGLSFYRARLKADGALRLSDNTAFLVDTTVPLPTPGIPVGLELRIEPLNTAETEVTVLVGNEIFLQHTFLGVDALVDSAGGMTMQRAGSEAVTTFIDNVVILATPHQLQFVGQKAITPTPGFGGPIYIADPDPGLEEFEG